MSLNFPPLSHRNTATPAQSKSFKYARPPPPVGECKTTSPHHRRGLPRSKMQAERCVSGEVAPHARPSTYGLQPASYAAVRKRICALSSSVCLSTGITGKGQYLLLPGILRTPRLNLEHHDVDAARCAPSLPGMVAETFAILCCDSAGPAAGRRRRRAGGRIGPRRWRGGCC